MQTFGKKKSSILLPYSGTSSRKYHDQHDECDNDDCGIWCSSHDLILFIFYIENNKRHALLREKTE